MREYPNRIHEFRKTRGLTQQQVADAIGTSHQTVQRLERGERKLTEFWMKRIAPVFNCPPGDLMLVEHTTNTGDQYTTLVACFNEMTADNRARLLEVAAAFAKRPPNQQNNEPHNGPIATKGVILRRMK